MVFIGKGLRMFLSREERGLPWVRPVEMELSFPWVRGSCHGVIECPVSMLASQVAPSGTGSNWF